jgi:hypothetical protein
VCDVRCFPNRVELEFEFWASCFQAGTLLLEPHFQSTFALVILEMRSYELLAELALNLDSPNLSLPSNV